MTSPFDYINAISHTKKNLIRDSEDPVRAEKDYNSYLINKGLSYFIDTILFANEMNSHHHLDAKLQNDYLINTIRPKKRFAKWVKKLSEDDLEVVKIHYGYNDEKARQALSILSDDQLALIKKKQEKGGTK
jgi:hypothetical protein